MKVGFVVPFLRRASGWRTAAIGAVRALAEHAGVEPVLMVGERDVAAAAELFPAAELVPVPEVQKMALSHPPSWPQLLRTWRRLGRGPLPAVDLVHSLDAYPAGLVGHRWARRAGRPHVVTALGSYAVTWRRRPPDSLCYRRVLEAAAAICPISGGTADLMRLHFGAALDGAPVTVVHLGTRATERIDAATALARRPPEVPTLLAVGAVKPRKGYHLSLEAFAAVKSRFPAARYLIVGNLTDRRYHRRLRERIAELGLDGVEFLGSLAPEELHRRYLEATLFVLTPQRRGLNFEGFGLVYLEAGAYALPVVATASGGVPDAVEDGVTGLLAAENDCDGIARAILRLLEDEALAGELGRANRRRAESFTWARFAERQLAVYQTLAPRAAPVAGAA